MKTLDLWCVDTLLIEPIPLHLNNKKIEGYAGSFPCFYTKELAEHFTVQHSLPNTVIRQVTITRMENFQ